MDDIDNFFSQEACDEFVNGIKFDYIATEEAAESKKEFAEALIDSDDLLLSSLLGDKFEDDIKEGKFNKFSKDEIVDILLKSDLAGMMYPKDKKLVDEFVKETLDKPVYERADLIFISKILVKKHN